MQKSGSLAAGAEMGGAWQSECCAVFAGSPPRFQVVEDLVKTWEFERSHKLSHVQHKSVDQQKFSIGANGGRRYDNVEANKVGNYNVLLDGVDPALWPQGQSWDKTHHLFKEAFPDAFPWEVLKVFSGPPKVAFSWRHWAHFTGAYQGHQGKGELVEMFGFATATVSADLKLQVCPSQLCCTLGGFCAHAHTLLQSTRSQSLTRCQSLVCPRLPFSGPMCSACVPVMLVCAVLVPLRRWRCSTTPRSS